MCYRHSAIVHGPHCSDKCTVDRDFHVHRVDELIAERCKFAPCYTYPLTAISIVFRRAQSARYWRQRQQWLPGMGRVARRSVPTLREDPGREAAPCKAALTTACLLSTGGASHHNLACLLNSLDISCCRSRRIRSCGWRCLPRHQRRYAPTRLCNAFSVFDCCSWKHEVSFSFS